MVMHAVIERKLNDIILFSAKEKRVDLSSTRQIECNNRGARVVYQNIVLFGQ